MTTPPSPGTVPTVTTVSDGTPSPGKEREPTEFDWIDIADMAINPTYAIPRTPQQHLAASFRRELTARPDATKAIEALRYIVVAAKAVRNERARAAVDVERIIADARAAHGKPGGAKKREKAISDYINIYAEWRAECDRRCNKFSRRITDGEVDAAVARKLSLSTSKVRRAREWSRKANN